MSAAEGGRERAEAYRRRLLDGLAAVIRAKGFRSASVADVVREARVSRSTFYEQFADLAEAYVALMRQENRRVVAATAAAVDPEADWHAQVEQAITAWSAASLQEPELVRSWIRELGALGEAGRDLQRELLQSFVELVHVLMDTDQVRAMGLVVPSRHTLVVLLGGLRELLATAFEDGVPADEVARVATRATIALVESEVAPHRS